MIERGNSGRDTPLNSQPSQTEPTGYALTTELRHRWLVAQRRSSGSGWCMHDGDHATLHDARTYVEDLDDLEPTVG